MTLYSIVRNYAEETELWMSLVVHATAIMGALVVVLNGFAELPIADRIRQTIGLAIVMAVVFGLALASYSAGRASEMLIPKVIGYGCSAFFVGLFVYFCVFVTRTNLKVARSIERRMTKS